MRMITANLVSALNHGNHPDFSVLNEESTVIKIEQIREFITRVIEKPVLSEKKVYIDGKDHEKEQFQDYVITIKNDVVTSSKTGVKFTIYDFSGAAGGYLELPYLEIKK